MTHINVSINVLRTHSCQGNGYKRLQNKTMALIGALDVNKTCWCILAIPMLFMNGLIVFKLWGTKTVQTAPIGTAVCAWDWDLSNYTGIKTKYNKIPAGVIEEATIIGPGTNISFHGRDVCKLKKDVLQGDRFCLLQNCTVANLTREEKRRLYRFLHLTFDCD